MGSKRVYALLAFGFCIAVVNLIVVQRNAVDHDPLFILPKNGRKYMPPAAPAVKCNHSAEVQLPGGVGGHSITCSRCLSENEHVRDTLALQPYDAIINKRCPEECNRNGICDNEGKCSCDPHYAGETCKEELNQGRMRREDLNIKFSPMSVSEFGEKYTCHMDQIRAKVQEELAIFSGISAEKISEELLQQSMHIGSRCTILQVIDGVPYRKDRLTHTPNRWRRFKRLFVNVNRRLKLPDVEFVICFDDVPLVVKHNSIPVFGFYKSDAHNDILLPADFQEYYYLSGLSQMRLYEEREAHPWSKKKDAAMWRGTGNGMWVGEPYNEHTFWFFPRPRLSMLSRAHPDLLDAGMTGTYGGNDQTLKLVDEYGRPGLSMQEQLDWKYLVVVDGNGQSDRYHAYLEGGSVCLKPRGPYYEYWDQWTVPYLHYVPVKYDFTDLIDKIIWLREHDDIAQRIAEHGMVFARNNIRLEEIYCYYGVMFEEWAKLLSFKPQKGPNAVLMDELIEE